MTSGLKCPSLADLPNPSTGIGWPWTEHSAPLPETQPNGQPWPKITIVTPSYNQGQFLEETIRSILLQGYPNLEYIVMDGGSTDGSIETIQKYEPWIDYWESEPDEGASHAISKGLEKASGMWFNWINSDDVLLPNALETVTRIARLVPEAKWITGGRLQTTETGVPIEADVPWQSDPMILGLRKSKFPQDATFARTDFLRKHDIGINTGLKQVYDTLFHMEMAEICKPVLTTAILSAFRQHGGQKTADRQEQSEEAQRVIQPRYDDRKPWMRAYDRVLRTRFRSLFMALLRSGVKEGIFPSARGWKAVVFDNDDYEWAVVDARETVHM